MLYCVKAPIVRKGPYYSFRFLLCKKRVPYVGFVYSKLGYLNNYFNNLDCRTAFFNISTVMKVSKKGFKMNRVGYRNLGTLLKYEKRKKRRSY